MTRRGCTPAGYAKLGGWRNGGPWVLFQPPNRFRRLMRPQFPLPTRFCIVLLSSLIGLFCGRSAAGRRTRCAARRPTGTALSDSTGCHCKRIGFGKVPLSIDGWGIFSRSPQADAPLRRDRRKFPTQGWKSEGYGTFTPRPRLGLSRWLRGSSRTQQQTSRAKPNSGAQAQQM